MFRRKAFAYYLFFGLNMVLFPYVFADEITMGVGFALPPYVIQESSSGIEIDILREAFAVKGHTVKFEYLPNVRTLLFFEAGKLDGTINVKKGTMLTGYYSDDVITFQNVAVSLKENNLSIEKILDLADNRFRVLAFQNASKVLGDEFSKVAEKNIFYKEIADQSIHSLLLLKGRVDVLVSDRRILFYHLMKARMSNKLNPEEQQLKLRMHDIFPPTKYQFVFKSEKIRDDFNEGLKVIRENGAYEAIIKRYQDY